MSKEGIGGASLPWWTQLSQEILASRSLFFGSVEQRVIAVYSKDVGVRSTSRLHGGSDSNLPSLRTYEEEPQQHPELPAHHFRLLPVSY